MTEDNKLIAERRGKLNAIRAERNAYPNQFRRSHEAASLHAEYDALDKETLDPQNIEVAVVGRMMSQRLFGKGGFAVLKDVSGDIQLFVQLNGVGEAVFALSEMRPGILAIWTNDGTISHEDSMRCLELMGQEVLPALREIGEELELTDPFQKAP